MSNLIPPDTRDEIIASLKSVGVVFKEDLVASREAAGLDRITSVPSGTRFDGQCESSPILAGNGEQAGFSSGATRSTDVGKVDYEGHINPEVLAVFGDYMNAHRVQRDGQVRASDNWQKGIPVYRYVKSLIRHTIEFWRMWRGTGVVNVDSGDYFTMKDVLSAILFNVMGIIYELDRTNNGYLNAPAISPAERERFECADSPKQITAPTQKERDDFVQSASCVSARYDNYETRERR